MDISAAGFRQWIKGGAEPVKVTTRMFHLFQDN